MAYLIDCNRTSGDSGDFSFLAAMFICCHYLNQYRIFYFFQVLDQIVLVHAFSKKAQQLKKKDIELAERRMEDWIRRFPAGGEV